MLNESDYVSVEQFYKGKSVFVTGGTGFLGKLLVEKLLWSCPGIKNIYLLIRPKENKSIKQRLRETLNSTVFDRLRQRRQNDLSKIIPIKGDLTKPSLGISHHNTDLLAEKISVVFHSAAIIKFNADLKTAMDINTIGTMYVIDFSHRMSKLEAFIHISTAYSNCDRGEIKEKVYPTPHDPEKIIESFQVMDDTTVQELTPKILYNRPNTYTFTKALAETILVRASASLPLAIVRPSIVVASMRDPVAGWIENWNGPTSLVVAIAKGIMRTVLCHENMIADLIPVDMIVNLTICAAWRTATKTPVGRFRVYNCCTGQQNPISWKQFIDFLFISMKRRPLRDCSLKPRILFEPRATLYFLYTLFFETLPAYVLDFFHRLGGKQPICVLIHKKLKKQKEALNFFTTHQWCFKDDNVKELLNLLRDEDRRTFLFDVRDIDWSSYLDSYYLGIRRFLLKEP